MTTDSFLEYNTTTEDTTQSTTLEDVSNSLWIYISPFIFIFGMTGHCLNLLVLRHMSSWHRSTVLLMIFLSMSDILVLCSGLSRYWVRAVFSVDIRTLSNWGCKLNLFVIYTTMQYSSWIRVSTTFERYLMTRCPLSYSLKLTRKRLLAALLSILVILMLINFHFFWTNGVTVDEDGNSCGSLNPIYFKFDEYVFVYIDLTVMAALPFGVMLTLSLFTIRLVHKSSRQRKSISTYTKSKPDIPMPKSRLQSASGIPLTRMLLFSSFYFIFATLPISIYFIVESYIKPTATDDVKDRLDLSWSVCYLFQYTIYGINFYVYVSSNAHYRHVLKQTCRCVKRYVSKYY